MNSSTYGSNLSHEQMVALLGPVNAGQGLVGLGVGDWGLGVDMAGRHVYNVGMFASQQSRP